MAKLVLTNPKIQINSVDMTSFCSKVELNLSWAEVPTTSFGSTAVSRVAGLADHSFSATFHADYANSAVEQTIFPLLGTTTSVVVQPINTTVSSTAPSYSFTVLVNGWMEGGSVGELSIIDVTWPISGAVTKATS